MEVSGQLHTPVPIGLEAGQAPEAVWMWGTENSSPYQDPNSRPSVIQLIASHYIDCIILAQSKHKGMELLQALNFAKHPS
jgi:hypothetical protein